jgi:alkanesulfonate monooxygenase SsuD/methylene tetrahydromethanopterin reductase-like flavin-dependent oxidoreductase (luciferase family)
VRLGVVVLPEHPWTEAAAIWRDAEALGFSHAWTYDHLAWRTLRDDPWFGSVPVLAAAATVTTTLRLGTLVASPNFRHPVPFAREIVALDDISGGRFDLGVGSGGTGWDATILGGPPWSRGERAGRFAEFVDLLDRLLVEREVNASGRWYRADGARSYPGCRQHPRVPFTVAATGRRAMSVVARFGQAWVTTGPTDGARDVGPDAGARTVAAQRDLLEQACAEVGRDPSELGRVVLAGPALAQGTSSAQELADTVGAYAAVGVTDLIVHWPRPSAPYQGDRRRFEEAVSGWS